MREFGSLSDRGKQSETLSELLSDMEQNVSDPAGPSQSVPVQLYSFSLTYLSQLYLLAFGATTACRTMFPGLSFEGDVPLDHDQIESPTNKAVHATRT